MNDRPDHSSNPYRTELEQRRESGLYRSLHPVRPLGDKGKLESEGNEVVNLCSNDYLNLSSHPHVRQRAIEMLEAYGTGSASSRLVSGSLRCHHDLEETLAHWTRRESALLFVSGFQANVTLLPALTGREDWILADKSVHRSLLEGGRLSRGTFRRFQHNDLNHLETLLKRFRVRGRGVCWVVVESIYSMDGDRTPLNEILPLVHRYGARLMVDDAHAIGLYGEEGRGLAADFPEVDLTVGTCGKSLGSSGAFALLSNDLKEWMVNYCPGVIYTTAPAPAVTGATLGAVELMPTLEAERKAVHSRASRLKSRLHEMGLETGGSDSQIIPVILRDSETALQWSRISAEHGFYIQAIRPPTVREPRLRLTVCQGVTDESWDRFLGLLGELHRG